MEMLPLTKMYDSCDIIHSLIPFHSILIHSCILSVVLVVGMVFSKSTMVYRGFYPIVYGGLIFVLLLTIYVYILGLFIHL